MAISAHAERLTRQIAESFDLVALVGEQVRLTRAGRDFKGLCPFHQEKTPSFYVSPAKQIFKCFGCGAGGDVFKFIQLRERVNFSEARAILAAKAGISLAEPSHSGPVDTDKASLARANDWAARWFRKQLGDSAAVRDYLDRRGVSAQSIETFELGFAPDSWDSLKNAAASAGVPAPLLVAAGLVRQHPEGRVYDAFRNRLMFPIRDVMNRVIGFGGRTLGDDPAKYLNTPQTALFDKSRCLYGLHAAKASISSRSAALVVEGYFDCLMAHQHGFTNAVATLGTALTPEHADLLRRFGEAVVLVFDSDDAGKRAAQRALPIFLAQRLDVRLVCVPDGKDPCDFLVAHGATAFEAVLNEAIGALESKWQELLARYRDQTGLGGRHRAIAEFLQELAAAAQWGAIDPIQRGLVVNEVAKLLEVPSAQVEEALRRSRAVAPPTPRRTEQSPVAEKAGSPRETAVSAATRELLEALLADGSQYERVAPWLELNCLVDAELQEIGRVVVNSIQETGACSPVDLFTHLESTEASARLADLVLAGESREDWDEVIEGAIARIELERVRSGRADFRTVFRDPAQATSESDAQALEQVERIRGQRQFAAPRHLRQTPRERAG